MRGTNSLTADALATSLGETLVGLTPDQYSQFTGFLPDTPWTTPASHLIQRRQGRAFIDSATGPKNLVVIVPGDPSLRTVDQVFLFGAPSAETIGEVAQAIRGPMEIVCDDDVAKLVAQHHPTARRRDMVVAWFARLEDADKVQAEPGPRRLRITEADQIAPLLPGWALRTYRTPKDLVTGGTVYVLEAEGRVASAGFTVDQSPKYERIAVSTWEALRGKGLASRAAAKVCRAVADQGRIPCAVIDVEDQAGLALAERLGFNERALLTTWTTSFRN
jgi:RimJ/RimL family protein N-acetyltransferase